MKPLNMKNKRNLSLLRDYLILCLFSRPPSNKLTFKLKQPDFGMQAHFRNILNWIILIY